MIQGTFLVRNSRLIASSHVLTFTGAKR